MGLLISQAHAQTACAAPRGSMAIQRILLLVLFVFFYFIAIRPQRKRQKEHANLVEALGKGDEVVMTSGMLGKITKLEGDYVVLEVSNNLELKFQKSAVHAVLPKGTIKAI